MTLNYTAFALLKEAYELLSPSQISNENTANLKIDLRAKIAELLILEEPRVIGGGSVQGVEDVWIWRSRAKEKGLPVEGANRSINGKPYADWHFPDGTTEVLPSGKAPIWPKA
jgi:hypothetical protein